MHYCVYKNKGISERYPLLLDVQSDIIDLGMGDVITADIPSPGSDVALIWRINGLVRVEHVWSAHEPVDKSAL